MAGAVTWTQEGANELGNLSVTSLALRTSDNTFVIGTHGSGMWVSGTYPGYTWLGGLNSSWSDASNWSGCGVPPAAANITIASTTNQPTLPAGTTTLGTLTLNAGTSINLGGNTLSVTGITGTGTITGSSTSSLIVSGAAGTLNFTSGSRILKDLTLNTGATATLGTPLDITGGASPGTVIVNSGATLTTGGNLTLKSDDNGTARVGISTGTITGNVSVERNIKNAGHRAWHLLSANTTGSQTIFNAWQEGGAIVANQGTWITSNLHNGSNGFDATSISASVLTHNQGGGGGPSWNYGLPNTNTTVLSSNPGYMLFVRGDRSHTSTLPTPIATNRTVLRSLGGLKQGTQAAVIVSATGTGRTLVGNPYASAIDMESIFTGTANLDQNMYIWDPVLTGSNGVGGFRLVTRTGVNTYTHTPVVLGGTTSDPTMRFIASGSAFFLKATGANANVVFSESVKTASVTTVYNPIVATPGDQQIIANLMIVEPGNKESLADGIRVMYNDANKSTTVDDIIKMGNFGENISSYRNGTKLIVEMRPMITANDTIFLHTSNTGIKKYRLQIGTIDFVQTGVSAFLEDAYLKTSKELTLDGTVNNADFSVTADALSAATDRFRIVFKTAVTPLPVYAKGISIYPNPVTNRIINFRLTDMVQGLYNVRLINNLGQVILTRQVKHAGGSAVINMDLNSGVAAGNYVVEILLPDNSMQQKALVIVD
jgi:hypothetical protein